MGQASQVIRYQPYPELIFSIRRGQVSTMFALISIRTRRHQQPQSISHQLFERMRMRPQHGYHWYLSPNRCLAKGALALPYMTSMQIRTALRL
jgi:hypothetical protein